jgi:hypothetical protein
MAKKSVRFVEAPLERSIEAMKHIDPVRVFFCDVIELLFHVPRVPDFHDFRESLYELIRNDFAQVRGVKPIPDLFYILPLLYNLDNLGISAGPSNALCFKFSYQGSF